MKSKYETHVLPYIDRIAAWVQKGTTAREVAKKLHISETSLKKYLRLGNAGDERYAPLAIAFTQACEEPDDNVECALYKRALGYQYEEITHEQKLDREGNVHELVKRTVKEIPPDPTSAMFWLTNRRPKKWSYKPETNVEEDEEGTGVVEMPAVMPTPEPPKPAEEQAEEGTGNGSS